MAYLCGSIADNGLAVLASDGQRLDVCGGEPASMMECGSMSLGFKTPLDISKPVNGSVEVAAIAGGEVTVTGNATHWAISGNGRMLACGPLLSPQAVVMGNTFSLGSFTVSMKGMA